MKRLFFLVVGSGIAAGLMLPSEAPLATDGRAEAAPIVTAPEPPSTPANPAVSGPWTTLERQDNGHFYARAQVNGQSVDFIVDTGASAVALTEADARRIGIAIDPSSYTVVGSGASGAVQGQHITLDSVTLDGKRVEGVSGAVLQGSEISLVGQSFLSRMGHIEISGDRMVIR